MIYEDVVLRRANELYAQRKCEQLGLDRRYLAPEAVPQIQSQQVLCLLEALVAEINQELKDLP